MLGVARTECRGRVARGSPLGAGARGRQTLTGRPGWGRECTGGLARPASLGFTERASEHPSPNPLPEAERGSRRGTVGSWFTLPTAGSSSVLPPPLRFGEGGGGRGWLISSPTRSPRNHVRRSLQSFPKPAADPVRSLALPRADHRQRLPVLRQPRPCPRDGNVRQDALVHVLLHPGVRPRRVSGRQCPVGRVVLHRARAALGRGEGVEPVSRLPVVRGGRADLVERPHRLGRVQGPPEGRGGGRPGRGGGTRQGGKPLP